MAQGMRPRGVGEILDAAIKLYVGNWRVLVGCAATVVVPMQLLSGLILLSTYGNGNDISVGFSSIGRTVTVAQAHAQLGASAINSVVSFVGGAFVLAALIKALSDAYLGETASIGRSLRFGLRRLLPLLVLEIVYIIVQVIAFLLLIIPGIWLYCAWSVRVPALVIERAGPFSALGRSHRLVKGRWWPSAGVLLVSQLMVGVLSSLLGAALGAAFLASGNPSVLFAVFISFLISLVSGVLLQPFAAAVITVLYYDLRIRKEGYDIELLADQLDLPRSTLRSAGGAWSAPGSGGSTGLGGDGLGGAGQSNVPPYWPPPPGWRPGS